ncbi:hypothetical protein BpHYR1_047664 [Brachionus plicatilis]|uniref:Uncharacterized protein n=1 Tax=Brachionus plicatilis TaxID=10195 RepID=A0A3M7S1H7_BRAPC|nr:hypothetical protein BpHYR1_047664 [Brachionus plicatilis]
MQRNFEKYKKMLNCIFFSLRQSLELVCTNFYNIKFNFLFCARNMMVNYYRILNVSPKSSLINRFYKKIKKTVLKKCNANTIFYCHAIKFDKALADWNGNLVLPFSHMKDIFEIKT